MIFLDFWELTNTRAIRIRKINSSIQMLNLTDATKALSDVFQNQVTELKWMHDHNMSYPKTIKAMMANNPRY